MKKLHNLFYFFIKKVNFYKLYIKILFFINNEFMQKISEIRSD